MAHFVMRYQRFILPVLAVLAGLALWAGCQATKTVPLPPLAPVARGLQPAPNDPRIAFWTARLLEEYHYRQQPLDPGLAEKFFDGYLDSLDPRHENFLQSDLAEFAGFRTNLAALTVAGSRRGLADLAPAFQIYDRYSQRFQQHSAYTGELLRREHFKFTADEQIQLDRRHAPYPKDLMAAQALWRQHLRYDYLQEKLAREITETNGLILVKPSATNAAEIVTTLARRYRWGQRMMTNLSSDNVLQVYLNALAHAYDPHSDYFSAPRAQDFSIGMNLGLFGIGAQLREDDGYCTIFELVRGGPADTSKQLKPKDRIIAVAQSNAPPVNVVDMDLEKVVQQIRGPKGTEVRLTISPAADPATRRVVTLVRDEINLESSEAKAQLVEMTDRHGITNRLGIIDLPSFYAPMDSAGNPNGRATPRYTSVDVAKLIKRLKLEGISGLIIDLRGNPGGSLEEAIRFTGLFIKDGPVVQARNPDGKVEVDADPDPDQLYAGPLVVLLNRLSASASEIAAAALQDYGRALIVGDTTTFGKGTVQNLNPLRPFVRPANDNATNDPGVVKITIRKFYRINGASTQFKGVESDIVLPDVLNYSTQIGEAALDNALPWDTNQPAAYDVYNLVQPYLAQLRTNSAARLATNPDYAYIQQDIAQFQKMQADLTAPLNENAAIQERRRVAAQSFAREQERAARPLPPETIYELTVKKSAAPGLPAPKPFYETNYLVTPVGPDRGQVKPDRPLVLLDTNTYPGYAASFTGYFQTNFPELAGAQFVYTNFPDTNIYVKIIRPLSLTNQVVKPVVTKIYSPDPALDETERILLDYISLLTSARPAVTTR